jgi:NAD+ kinase
MSSPAGSTTPLRKPVRRVGILSRGDIEDPGRRVAGVVRAAGAELVGELEDPELVVVLGGDGTMLVALKRYLGRGIPAIGVNFGRVGFLTAMQADELEEGLARAIAGDYRVVELPTLELELNGDTHVAVNDVVGTSSTLGRMAEISWALGEEELGVMPCDGVVCSTPSGSTAYNLSNGGPVLVWGLDAMAVTFVAPHSLLARPLVTGRGADVALTNVSTRVGLTMVADGAQIGELGPGERALVRLGRDHSLLATLPEATFVTRFRQHFAS